MSVVVADPQSGLAAAALIEVTAKISVDTVLYRFIMILIQ